MKIIGLNYDMMISSLCFLNNNKITYSAAEERLSRQKNSRNFPILVLKKILNSQKIQIEEIDYIVSSYNPGKLLNKFNPLISSSRRHFSEHLHSIPDNILRSIKKRDQLNSIYSYQEFKFEKSKLKIYYINHHDAHAANAFYQSGFKKALVFIVDLQGEISSTSVYKCNNNKFELLEKIDYPNSIGMLYASITEYLGFKANSDEWKVMAIANLMGTSEKYYKLFKKKIIKYDKFGNYDLNLKLFNGYYPIKPNLYNENLINILGKPTNNLDKPTKKQCQIASALQKVTYEIIKGKINYYSKKTKIKNICGAGGVFMNCLMNGFLDRSLKKHNLYIPFAPDDSGNSIGSAIYLSKNILGTKTKIKNIGNPYLGNSYENKDIIKILKKYKIKFKKSNNLFKDTAKILEEGNIIGWFQGPSEFGQRALGNRSILASPKIKNIKYILNKIIKYREGFRPFAPAVIEEKFSYFFEIRNNTSVPFMEKIHYLRKKYRKTLNSICHEDGSSRVQTVNMLSNNFFYKLLFEFDKASNIPILINTSFNIKGEPIVDNPNDAIKTFYNSGLDKLVLGNYIISK